MRLYNIGTIHLHSLSSKKKKKNQQYNTPILFSLPRVWTTMWFMESVVLLWAYAFYITNIQRALFYQNIFFKKQATSKQNRCLWRIFENSTYLLHFSPFQHFQLPKSLNFKDCWQSDTDVFYRYPYGTKKNKQIGKQKFQLRLASSLF